MAVIWGLTEFRASLSPKTKVHKEEAEPTGPAKLSPLYHACLILFCPLPVFHDFSAFH